MPLFGYSTPNHCERMRLPRKDVLNLLIKNDRSLSASESAMPDRGGEGFTKSGRPCGQSKPSLTGAEPMSDADVRQALLDEIIERELKMFLAVTNRGGVSVCQERPETFRTMRWTTHCVHSDAYLISYLEDLKTAERDGRNFMTEKYALMEGQIAPLSKDPRIAEIVRVEGLWRDDLARLYPHIFRADGGESFQIYLESELQTLSESTLGLYATEVAEADGKSENLMARRYEQLFRKMGYHSLAEREAAMVANTGQKG